LFPRAARDDFADERGVFRRARLDVVFRQNVFGAFRPMRARKDASRSNGPQVSL